MLKKVILFDSIFTTLIKVSEEILDKNIDSFIIHNLKETNCQIKNHNIFYTYLNLTKEYFVCYYKSKNKITIIDVITKYLKKNNILNKRVLVYFEEYFLLFIDSKFYYFQKIEKELLSQDIIEYINKRFAFEIEETIYINSSDLTNNQIKPTLVYIKDNRDMKLYFSYLVVLFFLCTSLFIADYYDKLLKQNEKIENEEILKKHQKSIIPKETFYYKISFLFNKIQECDLKISKFDFSKNSITVIFIAKTRESAYNFFKMYKNIKINSFLEIKDGYEISSTLTF